jgi:hypothetical protein
VSFYPSLLNFNEGKYEQEFREPMIAPGTIEWPTWTPVGILSNPDVDIKHRPVAIIKFTDASGRQWRRDSFGSIDRIYGEDDHKGGTSETT